MTAAKPEKTEYLKARVDEGIKTDFEGICAALEIKPAEQLRKLVLAFIAQEEKRLGERVQVRVTRPEGYQHGAWRVEIKLKKPEECPYPLVFPLPKLEKRSIHCDPEYRAAWFDSGTQLHEPGGVLQDGVWRGNCYTNGIAEPDNPTSLEEVEQALRQIIETGLAYRLR
ncbi:TPA: hypothetical protein SAN82_005638 [Pseudomonas putida]|nr:hypothetical protein [Pseudomonas putida]